MDAFPLIENDFMVGWTVEQPPTISFDIILYDLEPGKSFASKEEASTEFEAVSQKICRNTKTNLNPIKANKTTTQSSEEKAVTPGR
jgi:hypothetical protein